MLKQMRMILSKEGFEWEERKRIRQLLFSNMRVAFKIILEEMYVSRLELNCQTSVVSVTTRGWSEVMGMLSPYRNMQPCSTLWTTLDWTIRFPKHVWLLWRVCGMRQVSRKLFDEATNSLCMITYTSMSSNPFSSIALVCS